MHGASAHDVPINEDLADGNVQTVVAPEAPQQKVVRSKATVNATKSVTGVIFEVHCKAQLVNVKASNGQSYLVHFVSISGMPNNKNSLKVTCNKFLQNGVSVMFSGHKGIKGDITDAVLRL